MRTRTDLAGGLSEVRAKSAKRLRAGRRGAGPARDERREARDLLEPHPDGFGALGQERVDFRVATNPWMPTSPLRDAASGGELSRVMLALGREGAPGGAATYVFDEIDAGVGGNTRRAVGRGCGRSATRQVLCITHLPQVASLAERHFRIEKSIDRGAGARRRRARRGR